MSTTDAIPTTRGEVLMEAKSLTEGDRNQQHGDPYENLAHAAGVLNAMFKTNFDATDVGLIYAILKMVRVKVGDPNVRDHYVDMAAYVAMAWECQDRTDQGFAEHTSEGGLKAYREDNPLREERREADQGVDVIHGSNRRGTDVGIMGRAGIFPETDSRAVKRRGTDPGYRG